ncbi:hypothetical protein HGH92_19355 [Chitinophaga varians]|uniref:Uncharacterized protein n=1 Tax=Chitinophaga varians TaxID=2202339 RepID=A0A847RZC2_9BACT|nr:hypothetical protein [Chitinophaga varians]MBC9911831.1 hypothetical protein [Chitinophaga varians]NLR66475.1 hypothetical protein [Chitinophaga varians]
MKKKPAAKLKLAKLKIAALSQTMVIGDQNRTLPITQHKTCPPTYWVC